MSEKIIYKKFINLMVFAFWFSVFFGFSLLILSLYTGGDQVVYRKFYTGAGGLSYFESYVYARRVLGAYDPISIFFLWIGSWLGIPKIIYISFWNAFFLLVIAKVLSFYRVGLLIYPLVFSNFYILVLLSGAERLKFGVLFISLSVILSPKVKLISIFVSCLSHFQLFLLGPSLAIKVYWFKIMRFLRSGKIKGSDVFFIILSISFVLFSVFIFKDGIISKFNSYVRGYFEFSSLFSFSLLFLVAVLVSRHWKRMAISLMPFFLIILVLGESRVNILAVIFVFWSFMEERKISHPLSIILLLYFSFKSIGFMYKIYNFGNGFA